MRVKHLPLAYRILTQFIIMLVAGLCMALLGFYIPLQTRGCVCSYYLTKMVV